VCADSGACTQQRHHQHHDVGRGELGVVEGAPYTVWSCMFWFHKRNRVQRQGSAVGNNSVDTGPMATCHAVTLLSQGHQLAGQHGFGRVVVTYVPSTVYGIAMRLSSVSKR